MVRGIDRGDGVLPAASGELLKSNAPLDGPDDQRPRQRNATTQHSGLSSSITAAPGVPYSIGGGPFGGVNGIILQTIRTMGREVVANMRTLLARMA